MEETFNIFVPGRVCLFGEHSDWAGGYRRVNSKIERGEAIIIGTDQGIYASVKKSNKVIYHYTNNSEEKITFEIPLNKHLLLNEAKSNSIYSYICGVIYQLLVHYDIDGIEIDNYKTDLPVKKGLSSSAAICVLVARAYNKLYHLNMTIRGEMDLAYRGEITTQSRCGRLDQGCAFGKTPILMIFDGDEMGIRELFCKIPLYYILVDLNSSKNTIEILDALNKAYPFSEKQKYIAARKYLGEENKEYVDSVGDYLFTGRIEKIGELMNIVQKRFDEVLAPLCPNQLSAPILHKVLNYSNIQKYILGGKLVGSGGDGTAQLLVRNEEDRNIVIDVLKNELNLSSLKLTIPQGLS